MKATLKTERFQESTDLSKKTTEVEDLIRRRAYDLYEQRGRIDGYALRDWLQAESEVTETKNMRRAG